MLDLQIVEATAEHGALMAPNVRAADRLENEAASGRPLDRVLQASLDLSTHAWAALLDGKPAAIWGAGPLSLLNGKGSPWLIGTTAIEENPLVFLRLSRRYIVEIARVYQMLENHVDARNAKAIAWLAWLGFTIEGPSPYGVQQMPFHRFWMRSGHV